MGNGNINAPKKYFALTLDPVHVGAGGHRLGSVDNTIVREPATDVPKIPGTSLAGAIKEYVTIYYLEKNNAHIREEAEKEAEKYFGTEKKQGLLRFYDGQIVLFPVQSIKGTVWVTTKDLLDYWVNSANPAQSDEKTLKLPEDLGNNAYILKWDSENKINENEGINLGWLLLNVNNATGGKVSLPDNLNKWIKRIVVVSDKLFSHLVNDNLEVRTSVKIDSATGAAKDGALFTYEAIPRGTVLAFEVYKDWRRSEDGTGNDAKAEKAKDELTGSPGSGGRTDDIDQALEKAFKYLELLGIGGMGTRGFGRIKVYQVEDGKETGSQNSTGV